MDTNEPASHGKSRSDAPCPGSSLVPNPRSQIKKVRVKRLLKLNHPPPMPEPSAKKNRKRISPSIKTQFIPSARSGDHSVPEVTCNKTLEKSS